MKKTFINILLYLFAAGYCYSQNTIKSDSSQIVNAMNIQEECWNKGDIKCFMKHYWNSDSLRFITKSGVTYGWQATYEGYINRYPDKKAMGKLAFEIISVECLSEKVFLVVGTWSLRDNDTPVKGYYSLIWKKIDKKWVIIVDHTS